MKTLWLVLPVVALSGCSDGLFNLNRSEGTVVPLSSATPPAPAPTPLATVPARTPPPVPNRTAAEPPVAAGPDPAEPVELASAGPPPGSSTPAPAPTQSGRLGTTVASLGDPAEPGFWLKTPLVSTPTSGSVEYGATGRSVQVQLIPAGTAGGGSQISLSAMRLLDAPLTDLPELTVYAN